MTEKAKILLVDDDKDLVATLRLFLESKGYTVVAAHDAPAGLAQAQAQRPDVIVLDVMMPNMTEGFHFVWKLRQLGEEYFRSVPIVMLTAIHERTDLRFYPEDFDGTYRPGEYLPVQEFLDKPVDPVRLVERIEEVLALAPR